MIDRLFWKTRIENGFRERRIVWLSGVRRVGKTTLCQQFPGASYYDCELPSVKSALENPEFFFRNLSKPLIVLDEIHRLLDPSNILKIGHDHFPKLKIIATGSSTLGAKQKFKDSLTDRKRTVWLQPLLLSELKLQNYDSIKKRALHGGLPPAYFAKEIENSFYAEWLDSFWAKDVQELYPIERKTSFMKLAELILRQSGGIFEASSFAAPCEISRQTVFNYLEILNSTLFAITIRPFDRGKNTEIIKAPKVYGFDTGFVCFAKGWEKLRNEDMGFLLEHLLLEELLSTIDPSCIYYWRDKQRNEIDFVIKPYRKNVVHTIECKSSKDEFDPHSIKIFRKSSPQGRNILVTPDILEPHKKQISGLEFEFIPAGGSLRWEEKLL